MADTLMPEQLMTSKRRQKPWDGLAAPEPLERDIHEQCAKVLNRLIEPPAFWFPYPAGVVQLSAQQQAAYTRFGIKRGLPDLWIMWRGVYLIELKRRNGRLSKTRIVHTKRGSPRILEGQDEVFPKLIATGTVVDIAICHSVDEVLAQCRIWRIPLRAHH